MKDYVKQVLRTESTPSMAVLSRLTKQVRVVHAIMGLTTEVGELADALKKHVFYNAPLDADNIKEEAGDILWYLALLLDCLGLGSFDPVMEANIAKLRTRYPSKFTEDAAMNRDPDAEMKAMIEETLERR